MPVLCLLLCEMKRAINFKLCLKNQFAFLCDLTALKPEYKKKTSALLLAAGSRSSTALISDLKVLNKVSRPILSYISEIKLLFCLI